MKKIISIFFISIILVVSLIGCNKSPQNQTPTNSAILASYQGIDEFLLDCIKEDHSFVSSKLSNIDGNNFEQTYYHLKIQKYLGLLTNETTKAAFKNYLNQKLCEDITYLKYADVLTNFQVNQLDIEEYFLENPDVTKETIECYYYIVNYLGNKIYDKKNEMQQFLESNIPTESDYSNRLIMIYWYLDLCNERLINQDDIFLAECIDYLSSDNAFQFNSEDFYKYENLYYYISNCQTLGISTNVYEKIIKEIPDKLPYIFSSSELYYACKCLDIEGIKFEANDFFSSYYNFVTPTVNNLYPSYVVEYNNQIEEYQAFILLKYIFDSNDQRVVELENYLKEQTRNNLFTTESAAQSYYECQFCVLEGVQISEENLNIIRDRLETEKEKGNDAHNTKVYYYYLILNDANATISEADYDYILSQYHYLKSEQIYDLAIDFLKLISELDIMNDDDIIEEYKSISDSLDISYNLLNLEKNLKIQSDFSENPLAQKANLLSKCLIKDDAGVMYISTIYSDIMLNESENIGKSLYN